MKKFLALLVLSAAAVGCSCQNEQKVSEPPVAGTPATPGLDNCEFEPNFKVELRDGPVTLPAEGKFVEESHYATKEDRFAGTFPSWKDENIKAHLARSCDTLRKHFPDVGDCSSVYKTAEPWERQWTPANDGGTNKWGQGALGDVKPTAEQETFQGNMLFKVGKLPKLGTKFLVWNPANGKAVVVAFGLEIGPGDRKFLGGVTTEVHYALKASNSTTLKIAKLKDTSLPYGPIDCKAFSMKADK